ncbi:E3 ubiquitin-protein ligase pellino homolog 3-like [Octopus sinensis]|uniref:E3 ubiquitin-protein ligase pellino homolog 3-like n=1 Tax=Octopus sinensis TaxID=2607531 RepID=A0A6P7U590_9MOLL|nr:E3 ubiquitin-protein ligase pellino homolog 3-like [Octopus sinensis]
MFQIGRSPGETNDIVMEDNLTVSRFACRLLVSRDPPHTTKLYAGGFNDEHFLTLNQSFQRLGSWDGFTTNGVFIRHAGPAQEWKEVSVRGGVFPHRTIRTSMEPCGDNTLHDGSLIDLGGLTFIWRNPFARLTTPVLIN